MYSNRIKIFVIASAALLGLCLARLSQMQLSADSTLQGEIAELKLHRGLSRQLKSIRGKILDRKGVVLAVDEPQFQLHISYKLSCYMDERVRRAKLQKAAKQTKSEEALSAVQKEIDAKLEDLEEIINKCAQFKGVEPLEISGQIEKINDYIWDIRTFQAWRNHCADSEVFKRYDDITNITLSEAIADFAKEVSDPVKRLEFVEKVDIVEMHKSYPLLELKTDDDIFTAQLEFINTDGVEILPKPRRFYPYGCVAAQTIGWVGLATQEEDRKLFADDRLSSYLDDEVCGREDGVEYVCETILRGRRGEVIYDIDRQLVDKTPTQFGQDVSLTIDIELQKRIEEFVADCGLNKNCKSPTAAVVIDTATDEILALVSLPGFDLKIVRVDYGKIASDPNKPMLNRAINKAYPPGSVIKPVILIAGLESGKITADEAISCPAQRAPKGWPNCWLYNRYSWMGHDDKWVNKARNAIKGSCNVYFSRLADRIDSSVLQQWLFKFGYGQEILLPPAAVWQEEQDRNFREVSGQISTRKPENTIGPLPPIEGGEKRYFGIGQGNLRVTPLQVANAMATIARGGIYKAPQLFVDEPNDSKNVSITLDISADTLDVLRDGMSAVVNEPEGTAYNEFAYSGLGEQGVKVYGKTGSTQDPEHAWFGGFAEDRKGRSIAIAVVVEGGQHGSSDAGPLAREIIQFCIEAGYVGNGAIHIKQEPETAQ